MKLLELKLHNFRSYEHAHVYFSENQNYIFGRNWQGKSSLMDAIAYAMFGKEAFPRRIAGAQVKAEHLVRQGASEAWVDLTFEHGGHAYDLKRTCPRDRPSLKTEGKELGTTATTVKEALVELLGVNVDLFANVFYSEQDELRKVLEVAPEERKTFVEAIVGFEYLKELKLSAKRVSDELQAYLDGLMSGNIKTIVETSQQFEVRIGEIRDELKGLEEQMSHLGEPKERISGARQEAVDATKEVNTSVRKGASLLAQKGIYEDMFGRLVKGTCPTCGQPVSRDLGEKIRHELLHFIEQLDKNMEEAKKELTKLNSRLGEANLTYDAAYGEAVELQGIRGKATSLDSELQSRTRELQTMKKDIIAYGNKDFVFQRINAERSFLSDIQQAIEEFRIVLRSTMAADLENAVNFFMAKFGDGDFDAQLRITPDFGFEVLLHGQPVPVFNLSGAARDILALAIRYGLYRIASKEINFILLDEPTHHFDQLNTSKLKEALNELSEQQLIIITVHDEFSDAVGKKFRVEKDQAFTSVIREI